MSDQELAIAEIVSSSPLGCSTHKICAATGKTPQDLGDVLEAMKAKGAIFGFAGQWLSPEALQAGVDQFMATLRETHQRDTSVISHPGDQIAKASGVNWSGKPLDRILKHLDAVQVLSYIPPNVRAFEFRPVLPTRQRQFLDRVIAELVKVDLETPNPHKISISLGVPIHAVEEILNVGVQTGEVVQMTEQVFYTPEQVADLRKQVNAMIKNGPITASELRDAFDTTRKYAVALLSYLNPSGEIRRD